MRKLDRFNLFSYPLKNTIRIHILGLVAIVFVNFASLAQELNTDSLIIELKKHTGQDKDRVDLLNKISNSYLKSDLTKATSYAEKGEELAEDLGYGEGKGDSYYNLGKVALNSSEIAKAEAVFIKSLRIYQKDKAYSKYSQVYNAVAVTNFMTGDLDRAKRNLLRCISYHKKYNTTDNSDCMMNLGSLYGHLGNLEKSIVYFNMAKDEKIQYDNLEKISVCYLNLGVSQERLGLLPDALDNFLKAFRIDKKDKNLLDLKVSSIAVGRIYNLQKEYKKAQYYYKEGLRISRKYGDKVNAASALVNLGVVSYELKNNKKAENYYRQAIEILENSDDTRTLANVYHKLGQILVEREEYEIGLKSYEKSLIFAEKSADKSIQASTLLGLGGVYKKLGDNASALLNFLKAKDLAEKLQLTKAREDTYSELSDLYEKTNNFKLAHKYFKAHKTLQDSTYNQENIRKIAQLESENKYYDSLKYLEKRGNDLSIGLEKADVEKVQAEKSRLNFIIVSLLVIIILIGIIFFMTIRNSRQKIKNISVEQKLLRTQMTPHFIFNSLGIAQGMILNKEYDKSLNYLSDFSTLLRSNLENSRDKAVKLDNELATIRSYVNLQNSSTEDPCECSISIDKSVDASNIVIPPMLIQPFVENSIEHGFKENSGSKQIQITIQFDREDLVCVITDNGIGINHIRNEKDNPKTSMATQITKDRLKILAKEYKVNTGFSINDRRIYSEQGTTVTLILPYKTLDHEQSNNN